MNETKRIRLAVFERAEGRCEACAKWVGENGEVDHFFSRRIPESVEVMWLLCRSCHHHKTLNDPSNAWWVVHYAAHAKLHGCLDEVHRCDVRLAVLEQKGMTA